MAMITRTVSFSILEVLLEMGAHVFSNLRLANVNIQPTKDVTVEKDKDKLFGTKSECYISYVLFLHHKC